MVLNRHVCTLAFECLHGRQGWHVLGAEPPSSDSCTCRSGRCMLWAWGENSFNSFSHDSFALCSRILGPDDLATAGLSEWTQCHFRHSLKMGN